MVKKLLVAAVSLIVTIAILCACSNSGVGETGISLAEFSEISIGMTQEKVEEIIGGKGTKISEWKVETEEYTEYFTLYKFDGQNSGYAELEFSLKGYRDILKVKYPRPELTAKTKYDLS